MATSASISWLEDLNHSRDLSPREIDGYGFLLGWYESWRVSKGLVAGRESSVRFWREAVKAKERPEWQLQQWVEAIRWFLRWLEITAEEGSRASYSTSSLPNKNQRPPPKQLRHLSLLIPIDINLGHYLVDKYNNQVTETV